MIVGWAIIENIVTLLVCAAIVLGLYAMGAGFWSFAGFAVLLNLNYFKSRKDSKP